MDVQGCRLPAFKTPQAPRRHSGRGRPFLQLQQVPEAVAVSFYGGSRLPLASIRNSPTSPNPPLQLPGATQAGADLSCSSNKSLRPWQRLFMDVQGCRLPALKTPQTLPCSSQAPLRAAEDLSCTSNKSLRPWQCPFKEVQGWFASLQNSPKLPKPSPAAPRRHSGRGRPFLQLSQVPEAVAASFYGRSRLPFASPQNSPNPPLQLPGATQAAADLSCSSNKSLRPWQCPFMPAFETRLTPQTLPCSSQAPLRPRQTCSSNKSLSPWQRLFMDVQGCRLPALKTPQTLPCSSQAPLRPRQTFPAASNKSLRPWQCPFKEVQGWFASLQNSPKLPK